MHIEAYGSPEQVTAFTEDLRNHPPELAVIDSFITTEAPDHIYEEFSIRESHDQRTDFLPVSVDLAICADCKHELFDPKDRRYRYPFINCTHCGPRFSIVKTIPYDRPNTSMSEFTLCPECLAEYQDPLNRRFHAQPVACAVCGPSVWLEQPFRPTLKGETAIKTARKMLAEGNILAIKGLGGFHLACDASNLKAVDNLRLRKHRTGKPFAVMTCDLETALKFANLGEAERSWLTSPQAPIILADPTVPGEDIRAIVAPDQSRLGIMIAYTPLHLLLLEPGKDAPQILVMTSGNLSEEPIVHDNLQAQTSLQDIADGMLLHDRPILTRIDDSVIASLENRPYLYRRARGYAPSPIILPFSAAQTLAVGPHLKNTFCLTREQYVFISQHIGDLDNQETLDAFEASILHNQHLFRVEPELLACDLHPAYLSTRYAQNRAETEHLPLVQVQHHHAHLAACLAENKWTSDEPVIGLIFDGTGYGSDGTIWGGEVLVGGYSGFKRQFHLNPVPMPGGDLAALTPARMAISYLLEANIDYHDLPPTHSFDQVTLQAIRHQCLTHFNAPLTSSMGRLFDAVASLIGLKDRNTYEAETAIRLEAIAEPDVSNAYPFEIKKNVIETSPLIHAVVDDYRQGASAAIISARFHNTIVWLALQCCRLVREEAGLNTVAISGGVWQNLRLMRSLLPALRAEGFKPLIHRHLPPNDGCVALGQATVAQKVYKG